MPACGRQGRVVCAWCRPASVREGARAVVGRGRTRVSDARRARRRPCRTPSTRERRRAARRGRGRARPRARHLPPSPSPPTRHPDPHLICAPKSAGAPAARSMRRRSRSRTSRVAQQPSAARDGTVGAVGANTAAMSACVSPPSRLSRRALRRFSSPAPRRARGARDGRQAVRDPVLAVQPPAPATASFTTVPRAVARACARPPPPPRTHARPAGERRIRPARPAPRRLRLAAGCVRPRWHRAGRGIVRPQGCPGRGGRASYREGWRTRLGEGAGARRTPGCARRRPPACPCGRARAPAAAAAARARQREPIKRASEREREDGSRVPVGRPGGRPRPPRPVAPCSRRRVTSHRAPRLRDRARALTAM